MAFALTPYHRCRHLLFADFRKRLLDITLLSPRIPEPVTHVPGQIFHAAEVISLRTIDFHMQRPTAISVFDAICTI